jgi:predicted transcriptional regulator
MGLVSQGGDRSRPGEEAMYGTMYGMAVKTTVYLTDDLKRALEVEAAASGRSEAEIIREAIAARVGSARPAAGFLDGEPMAEHVDELLAGFGEAR